MATDKTRADLVVEALGMLGADGGAGQSPAPEDVAKMDSKVDAVLESLSSQAIYTADPDAIPLDAFLPLAVHLAEAGAVDFGRQPDDVALARATRTLKLITAQGPTGAVMAVDYM